MGKMRYLIALFEAEDGYEGILLTETGIILKRETDTSEKGLIKALSSIFPIREASVCLSGEGAFPEISDKWKKRQESRGEALIRSAFGEGDGAVLFVGKSVYAVSRKEGKMREATADWGKRRMAEEAIRRGLKGESTWLCHAMEEATGLPKAGIPDELATLPEEKRFRYARLIRDGAVLGDMECLALVRKALDAFYEVIRKIIKETGETMPFIIIGPAKTDMPLLEKGIQTQFPGTFSFQKAEMPPIFGSAVAAAKGYKKPPDEGFRRRFQETYSIYI